MRAAFNNPERAIDYLLNVIILFYHRESQLISNNNLYNLHSNNLNNHNSNRLHIYHNRICNNY